MYCLKAVTQDAEGKRKRDSRKVHEEEDRPRARWWAIPAGLDVPAGLGARNGQAARGLDFCIHPRQQQNREHDLGDRQDPALAEHRQPVYSKPDAARRDLSGTLRHARPPVRRQSSRRPPRRRRA